MKNMPISRNVYKDITTRIAEALTGFETSRSEAVRIFESYLNGGSIESDDKAALVAFSMVKDVIDRAMERSRKARERADKKRIRVEKELQERIDGRFWLESTIAYDKLSWEAEMKNISTGDESVKQELPEFEQFSKEWIIRRNRELSHLSLKKRLDYLIALEENPYGQKNMSVVKPTKT